MTLEQLVLELVTSDHLDKELIRHHKKKYARLNKISGLPSNMQLLKMYRELLESGKVSENLIFQDLLKKRSIRSQSGIVSVQVLTKPFYCPGECIFCPSDFTMPKSYINTEPGAMRALLNNFDPIKQVYNRLLSLYLTGHDTDKIEMIVLGGTRDVYPEKYKREFIKGLYDACNTFPEFLKTVQLENNKSSGILSIADRHHEPHEDSVQSVVANSSHQDYQFPASVTESILINETAQHRMIGLTIETRPEYVTHENCQERRSLGVTRLEMGLQSTDNEVLEANKRGHDIQCCRDALHLLRQYGFKFSVHIMPGLYQSTEAKDIQTFVDLYSDPYLKPDEIKLYPTSVIPNTELYEIYKAGKYIPITTEAIERIVASVFEHIIPPYTRIKRLIRDIPTTEIVAGSSVTNLAQLIHRDLYEERNHTDTIRRIYQRLYDNPQSYQTLDEFLTRLSQRDQVLDAHTTLTHIIGGEVDTQSDRAFVSLDTRSREIRHKREDEPANSLIIIREFLSSVGKEFFISLETSQGYLYGFTRLLLPDADKTVDFPGLGASTAMIRELHVYGKLASLVREDTTTTQHTGVGRTVMLVAERIAQQYGYSRLSVISGVGVKEYYRSVLHYHDEGSYVVKSL